MYVYMELLRRCM